jgi:predicted O-methyltransferase YrrM
MLRKIANICINIVPTKILNLKIFKKFFLNESIFNLFFSKQYYAVNENYEKNKNSINFNNDEIHLIFASKVIIDQNISEILKKLRTPLKKKEVIKTFKEDLVKEKKNKKNGILRQPEYISKSMLAAMIGFKYKKKYFIETGTFIGQSTYNIQNMFKKIYTCEASKDLYKAAKKLFYLTKKNNIKIYLGDSKIMLKSLNKKIFDDSIFFLDAHYSKGNTSKEFGACPLIDELKIIFSNSSKAIIVIDDIRTMNGKNGYPKLLDILNYIPNNLVVKILYDQLIINP